MEMQFVFDDHILDIDRRELRRGNGDEQRLSRTLPRRGIRFVDAPQGGVMTP
jgi:DNA-binding winged helix-turn-helix (wHTH) protein